MLHIPFPITYQISALPFSPCFNWGQEVNNLHLSSCSCSWMVNSPAPPLQIDPQYFLSICEVWDMTLWWVWGIRTHLASFCDVLTSGVAPRIREMFSWAVCSHGLCQWGSWSWDPCCSLHAPTRICFLLSQAPSPHFTCSTAGLQVLM